MLRLRSADCNAGYVNMTRILRCVWRSHGARGKCGRTCPSRCATRRRVRLVEIDAPERAQAFGNRSKQSLSERCFNKAAKLDETGKDRYGRILARVYCDGVDANAEQVRRGMAWVYERCAPKNLPLYGVHTEAKAAKHGLWADNETVPPWDLRRAGK